jgi:isocitrate dehydrogenase (NAD+)
MALLFSGTMMLRHIGEEQAAKDIENATERTLIKGIKTYDLHGNAKLSEFAEAICSELKG